MSGLVITAAKHIMPVIDEDFNGGMIDQDLQSAYFILSDFGLSYTTAAAFCIFRVTFLIR